jgi:hypothetical protein
MGVNAPLFVARASYFAVPAGYDAAQMIIHAAQVTLPNASAAITLRAEWRVDGCHFSIRHAGLWFEILTEFTTYSLIDKHNTRPHNMAKEDENAQRSPLGG